MRGYTWILGDLGICYDMQGFRGICVDMRGGFGEVVGGGFWGGFGGIFALSRFYSRKFEVWYLTGI